MGSAPHDDEHLFAEQAYKDKGHDVGARMQREQLLAELSSMVFRATSMSASASSSSSA